MHERNGKCTKLENLDCESDTRDTYTEFGNVAFAFIRSLFNGSNHSCLVFHA